MPSASFHFPKGFLWGTATSSHQVEGGNTNNNWWAWEQQEGRILKGHKSGLACDWWGGRWREDFDRAAETGQNAHRLSVEWSRIQPTPDTWDEEALEKYRAMLRGLKERGIMPMVTLHHFSDPLWVAEKGAWETEAVVPWFERFVRKTVDALVHERQSLHALYEVGQSVNSTLELEAVFETGSARSVGLRVRGSAHEQEQCQ